MKTIMIALYILGSFSAFAIEQGSVYKCQYKMEVFQHNQPDRSYVGTLNLTVIQEGALLTNDNNFPNVSITYYSRFGVTVNGTTVLRTRIGMGGSLQFPEGSLMKKQFTARAENISGDEDASTQTSMKCILVK